MRCGAGIFVVAGTDTGVGKTVFAAGLAATLDAAYWKPVQAGLAGETDAQAVCRLGGLDASRIVPSAFALQRPASPHIAARNDGVAIRQSRLALPVLDRPLVVETAGGVMVPLSERLLQVDLMAHWQKPVVLVARTELGTINHTLLSLEALRRRRVPVMGVAFVGEAEPEVEASIVVMGHVRRLGRLPALAVLDAGTLRSAFADAFDSHAFMELGGG